MTKFIDTATFDSFESTQEGYLMVDARLTRVGVFEYRMADGSVKRMLRPPEEVFRVESLASIKLKPFTDDHPQHLLDVSNTKHHQVGTIGENIRQDGDYVRATVMVTDAEAIKRIRDGKRQVSMGYVSEEDHTPGVWRDGTPYDTVQRNIVYNHGSLVDVGRAGPEVRLLLDAASIVINEENMINGYKTDAGPDSGEMMKLEIAGVEFEVDKALYIAIQMLMQQAAGNPPPASPAPPPAEPKAEEPAEKTDAADVVARMDALKEQNEELQAKLDALTGEAFTKAVAARVALQVRAGAFLGDSADLNTMSDVELKRAALKAAKPQHAAKYDAADEAYINSRWQIMADEEIDTPDSTVELRKAVVAPAVQPETKSNKWEPKPLLVSKTRKQ